MLLTLSLGLVAKSVNPRAIVDAQQEHQDARRTHLRNTGCGGQLDQS
jgi:hypothetical protein